MKKDYRQTLNLPKTNFPMKADLIKREPQIRKFWAEINIYEKIRRAREGKPRYILHDGPPYASGELHIGTGLNKILKDIVVKYKTMKGFDSPFLPGWDCHGLPIEQKVLEELGEKAKEVSPIEIRRKCRDYALAHIESHKKQFEALGVFGDWEGPYLTLEPDYEAGVLDIFADLVEGGYIYRELKSIHWCMHCVTALAEAEIEYDELASPSIYVKFTASEDLKEFAGEEELGVLIWTTTPWTLPGNRAIALHPEFDYSVVSFKNPKTGKTENLLFATECADRVMAELGVSFYEVTEPWKGRELEGKHYRHFFTEGDYPLVLADYVVLDEGSGCVHTAPGHGREDYETGRNYGLEIASPVDDEGKFTAEAGKFAGLNVFNAEPVILRELESLGVLLASGELVHSYPHCWRCKSPVIFRATPQWFISVDHAGLRQRLLKEIERVRWIPRWGQIRISSMVEQRPDWCISRQRSWGVPIPAFYCWECGLPVLEAKLVRRIRNIIAEHGSDYWFESTESELLPEGFACPECGSEKFMKETDILDVWFESGASHRAVLRGREELGFPCDLYLEGTDQHRGWFQVALIEAVASDGRAPYREVLTHGFVVDENGQKMSKSLGNFISVEQALEEFGGDLQRLWVASCDYRDDIRTSRTMIGSIADAYRKIRNTFRYLLGNIYDFDPRRHSLTRDDMLEIDRWALSRLYTLLGEVTSAYDNFEFHRVYHRTYRFCVSDLSSFYFDILKDRLYTFGADSPGRRSAQTSLYEILSVLVRVFAPILVYTTEEVWQTLGEKRPEDVPSVHLAPMPEVRSEFIDPDLEGLWSKLLELRDSANVKLEEARSSGVLRSSLEASISVVAPKDLYGLLKNYEHELPYILICSEVKLEEGNEPQVSVSKAPYQKCERCWNLRPAVGSYPDHPTLCDRCYPVVTELCEK